MSKKKVKPPKEKGNGFLYGTIIFLVILFIVGAIITSRTTNKKVNESVTLEREVVTSGQQ